jgi:hypothetical protein
VIARFGDRALPVIEPVEILVSTGSTTEIGSTTEDALDRQGRQWAEFSRGVSGGAMSLGRGEGVVECR